MTKALIFCITILSGCSLLPSWFDSQEHAQLITLSQITSDITICADSSKAQELSQRIYQQAQWLYRYGHSLPRNEKMSSMSGDLLSMSQELRDRYLKPPVNQVYCRNKLQNINKALETMISVSARRPRP